MSNLLLGYAFQLGLEPSLKLVYMGLADAADDDGGNCYPKVATLARKASISERQAQRNLKILRADDWCSIVGNEAGGRKTRRYRINVQKLREKADEAMEALRGDKLSPLKKTPEGCRLRHRKGDTGDTPAVPSTSPELLVELSSTTTTTPLALIFPTAPPALPAKKGVVVEMMRGLNPELQQQLIDEFWKKLQKTPPNSPMGWFHELVRSARNGTFVPNLCLAVAAERVRHAQEVADQEAARLARAEAQKRLSERQALLDQMGDSQVRELLLVANPELKSIQIDDWLKAGRPKDNTITALARAAIAATDEDVRLPVESEA